MPVEASGLKVIPVKWMLFVHPYDITGLMNKPLSFAAPFLYLQRKTIMGKFVITKRTNGEFQFNLKAGNGQTILASEGYSTKASCENGIESVKRNAQDDGRYELKTSSNGKFYFTLKASNGQVIGMSEMYESSSSRDNGIASVKSNAADATIDDQTA